MKLENLKENNEWFCPQCKEFQKASKKMEIYRAPQILVIHLKRFSANEKIDTLVDFPINDLDLNQYIISKEDDQDLKYDLFAISNHYGGLGGGHYIAFAKNNILNKWYKFDDSSIYDISENNLVSSAAYVLFYRKRNSNDLEKFYVKSFQNYEKQDNKNCDQNNNEIIQNNSNFDYYSNPIETMEVDTEVICPSNNKTEEEFKNSSS